MNINSILIKKAIKSDCVYKVACLCFNNKGDLLGTSVNKHGGYGKGLSIHAEIEAIRKYGKGISSIVLCRTNKQGKLLPIHPCSTCMKLLNKYNIKVYNINKRRLNGR